MSAIQTIQSCQTRLIELNKALPLKEHQLRVSQIDELMTDTSIWEDNRKAAGLLKERQQLVSLLDEMKRLSAEEKNLSEYLREFPGEAEDFLEQVEKLESELSVFELSQMMKDPVDDTPAIIVISSGAGGLESSNWVSMLLRMYLRFADAEGFKSEILDMEPSGEHSDICIDSVSIRIEGKNAYGYLKGETGPHRLIRNSPFNSGDARHTSFAAVSVSADVEDKIEIEVLEKDLEIKAVRSSGSGGQNVSKVSSCVYMKHIPSGIALKVQNERSQLENKRLAYKLLRSRLYALEEKKRNEEKERQLGQQAVAAFGNQIRTTTVSNYSLVRDHRSEHETSQADDYLDGNIMPFLLASLKLNLK